MYPNAYFKSPYQLNFINNNVEHSFRIKNIYMDPSEFCMETDVAIRETQNRNISSCKRIVETKMGTILLSKSKKRFE